MSKPNEQVFTGTSTNGNLQEALDAAIAQIGHGGPWRLASIDGVRGIVPEVNVRIFALAGALTADAAARPGQPGAETTTAQGVVEEIPADTVSFCQDGAQYELVTTTADGEERLRLRAAPGRAANVLRRYAGTGQEVSVTGPVSTVECTVMDVIEAQPVHATADSGDATAAAAAPSAGAETRQGLVEQIPAGTISICMDGAEYELVSRTVDGESRLRLKAVNGRAGAALRRFADKGVEVSVTGPIVHVECTRMDVEHAQEALVAT
jgi:hypothetical protein